MGEKDNIIISRSELKVKQANCFGETQENTNVQKGLVIVLNLIGWEGGASFLDQSQSEVKKNLRNHG